MRHQWECDCGETSLFRQPELPQEDYDSEQNKSKTCPECGGEMYFDEVDE